MTLIEALQTIPDPRKASGCRYPLWIFLLLIILGTMSGYRGYRGLARFMERHQGHLATRLGLVRQDLPSYSTIRRLLNWVDFNAVADAFNRWGQAAGLLQAGDDCALDGKGLKNTVTDAFTEQQTFVNIVSMFQLRQGVVVAQAVFNNAQESEIDVVYQLLEHLQVSGVTVSLDALHAQKKTVELIIRQGNDYVIQVKANQKTLHQQLQHQAELSLFSVDLQRERTRDRQTTRIASVFELSDDIKARWSGAQLGVEVIRQGTRQGEPHCERHYYLTSWRTTATALQTRIRAHWGIENPLHWVKDVVLGEDHSSIRAHPAAAVMAVIRNLAITLFRRAGHTAITTAIDLLGNDLDRLLPLVGFSSG
jgi:predicted transposase YbfD/YdcC